MATREAIRLPRSEAVNITAGLNLEPRKLHIVEAPTGSALWACWDRGEDSLMATEASASNADRIIVGLRHPRIMEMAMPISPRVIGIKREAVST